MFFKLIYFLLFLILPIVVVDSLQCYDCNQQFVLNYTLTSDTIPSISTKCQLIDSVQCAVWIEWNIDTTSTTIGVHGIHTSLNDDTLQDRISTRILMNMKSDNETLSLSYNADYYCKTTDRCNDENNLKQILRSLTIQDQFRQELSPLLKVISPFNAKQANCLDLKNITDAPCSPTDLDTCQRCEITSQQLVLSNQQICATCSSISFPMNIVGRGKMFLLNNRTEYIDYTILDCQLNGCNSIENNNRIYQASKIIFNFDEFYLNK